MKLIPIKPNMTQLTFGGTVILFSYRTPVACQTANGDYFRTSKKFSPTTTRHINTWLKGVVAEEKPQEFFDNLFQE